MKDSSRLLIATILLMSCIVIGYTKDDNNGIINGPITDKSLGHKTKSMGDRESLKLAIEDLISTHGEAYPKGAEFLKRLNEKGMDNPASEGFKTLQKEALLANPDLDFKHILSVRGNYKPYSSPWQTLVSISKGERPMSEKDIFKKFNDFKAHAEVQKCRQIAENEAKMLEEEIKKLKKTKEYGSADKKNQEKMIQDLPSTTKVKEAKDKFITLANEIPGFAEEYEKIKSPVHVYNDELVAISLKDGKTTVILENTDNLIADVDLHFDGNKLLYTSFREQPTKIDGLKKYTGKGFSLFEANIDPTTLKVTKEPRLIPANLSSDSDSYDPCYLPDGKILFASTAAFEGVPCVGGVDFVANLYRMNSDGSDVRRLTFDQEGNWHPTVMESGRVMYVRWEYTDSAHYFSRIVFTMNPDGTDQKGYYGSNSYWPNSMFFMRQIPGSPNMFIATVTGHHGGDKGGALCLFDVSKGRHEASGAVQFITGRGKKVVPVVLDGLQSIYQPWFYEPYPINNKYFLASSGGKIYLLDVFDNMVQISENGSSHYSEPIPLKKRSTPRALPDRTDDSSKTASVLINDIYAGPGIKGVPRGTVKELRVYRYEFSPRNSGGHYAMGMEAGWDAKQILGTAPVEEDGSVHFTIPSNTPFAMQPLDKDGNALQIMRSWTSAMPGERLSCIGCHEDPGMAPPVKAYKAMLRGPSELKPFFGPVRGFSYTREIQPILDKYCISCHDGKAPGERFTLPDRIVATGPSTGKNRQEIGLPNLTNPKDSHLHLHPYVRRNGPEGDYHLLTPLEFHTSTSKLFKMLKKGHHNVRLDEETFIKLSSWVDINVPFHGTWTEAGANSEVLKRRMDLREKYADVTYNAEIIHNPYKGPQGVPVLPEKEKFEKKSIEAALVENYVAQNLSLDISANVTMTFASIPAGSFDMGSQDESPQERPISRVSIQRPFYMGTKEVTLGQYREFDPEYLNGVYDMHFKDQVHRGYYMNDIDFPVIRVSWKKAVEFCEWLSKKTGKNVRLPSEAQWEWACRAGSTTPLWYGNEHTDFSKNANLADASIKLLAVSGVDPKPIKNPNYREDYELQDPRFNDGVLHLAKVAKYSANPWGLYDMHGNVSEWTQSSYLPYPYNDNAPSTEEKVVRGGSWYDRPQESTSSYRYGYKSWQRVFDVGFRVIIE